MNHSDFVAAVARALHPDPYGLVVDVAKLKRCSLDLLLEQPVALLARYALAVAAFDERLGAEEQVEILRDQVVRATGALWCFRGVGLYVVLAGAASAWEGAAYEVAADRTGLHHAIVQAVHLVDPATGVDHLAASAWGPVRFGGADAVAQRLRSLLPRPRDAREPV